MNGGEFARLPFARDGITGLTIQRRVRANDELLAQAGLGETAIRDVHAFHTYNAHVTVVRSHVRALRIADALETRAAISMFLHRHTPAKETLAARTVLNARYYRAAPVTEVLEAAAILNKERLRRAKIAEALAGAALLNRGMNRFVLSTDDLEGFSDAVSIHMQTDQINVTIPAGGRLVLDTEHFTVALVVDGVTTNVYQYHLGDFATIDENTLDVLVSAGTGGELSGFITLTERYL